MKLIQMYRVIVQIDCQLLEHYKVFNIIIVRINLKTCLSEIDRSIDGPLNFGISFDEVVQVANHLVSCSLSCHFL